VEQKLFLAERKANSLAQMLNRVNETKDQYKEMKKNVVEKKISLKDAIAQIEKDMSATQAEIEKRERDSIGIEANIRSTQNRVNVLQEKISTSKAILLQYLEVIYTK
jgi:chromosome segregation ATPase